MFNADPIISDARFRMSLADVRWNEYDETIKKEVAFYNQKFAKTPGFVPLDWRYVKAMVWSEVLAGPKGNSEQWRKIPLQIGRYAKDRGYDVVSGKANNPADFEKMNLVSPELSPEVQNKSSVVGNLNVRAGIAYLYIRAIGEVGSLPDKIENPQILTGMVQKNEGLDAVAGRLETTTNNIIKNNSGIDSTNLQPGQAIKYQKAKAVRAIIRWNDWKPTIRGYNGDAVWGTDGKKQGAGDPDYMPKVERAYKIITSRQP